jgi:hypothetical protein
VLPRLEVMVVVVQPELAGQPRTSYAINKIVGPDPCSLLGDRCSLGQTPGNGGTSEEATVYTGDPRQWERTATSTFVRLPHAEEPFWSVVAYARHDRRRRAWTARILPAATGKGALEASFPTRTAADSAIELMTRRAARQTSKKLLATA